MFPSQWMPLWLLASASVDLSPAVGPSLRLRPDSIHVGTSCANTESGYHPLSSGYSVLSEMARCQCLWIKAYFVRQKS